MVFENKIISREIGDILYATGLTVSTAESCTGGRIGENIMATPGASNYFKGGIISYTNEIKERLLQVSADTLNEKTAVCEEVARQMVLGAINTMKTGPGDGTPQTPVGTIWIACGSKDNIVTLKLTEDFGRDINIAIATNKALRLFLDFLNENKVGVEMMDNEKNP